MDLKFKKDLSHLIKMCIELQMLKMKKYIQDKDDYILSILESPIQFGNCELLNTPQGKIRATLKLNFSLEEGL